jgi:predicted ATPase/DNA-binding SARP family transcriptional activator/Tfp pilus assembly protein PilF
MQALRLRLFGTPALLRASGAEPLLPERLTQLAIVLAACDDWTTRDRIVALLWPDLNDGAARRNLRKLLFRARREAWFQAVQTRTDALCWHADSDLRDFESAITRQDWAHAVSAYSGALCDGFEHKAAEPFVEWLHFERNRLAAQFRTAMAQRLLELGADAVQREQVARQWLALDPLDEDALAAMVEAIGAQGRRGEVQRTVEQFRERLAQEVGVAPSARVRALLDEARSAAASTPHADAGLVGRRSELREAQALLGRDECRVLTLMGPGGVGKSRLARALVAALRATFGDIRWVGLEDLMAADQVVPRIAAVLDASLVSKVDPFEQLVAALNARPRQLLVFDNCEHLQDLAMLVDQLTRRCESLKLLVTSRARLAANGEWLLPLDGLAVPDVDESEAEAIRAFDAVKLFEQRAHAAAPAFDAGRHALEIAALSRLVDGMPLAIELAAPWVRVLPVAEITSEIGKSIDLLARDGVAPDRQRSVRASFEHSWRLLNALEQRCLSQLAVFAAPFTREAAEQVAAARLPVLVALSDKSLLRAQDDGRFSLHPLLRQCARGMASDDEVAQRRHCDYFALRLGHLLDHEVGRPSTLQAMDTELEDVRAAWQFAIRARDGAATEAMAPRLGRYFGIRGRRAEAITLFGQAAIAWQSDAHVAYAAIQEALGGLYYNNGDLDQAEEALRTAIRLQRALRRGGAARSCLYLLGAVLYTRGDFVPAERYFEQARRRAHATADTAGTAKSLNGLAACARAVGNYARALELQREALSLHESLGNVHEQALLLNDIGVMLHTSRRYGEARDTLRRGLALAGAHGLDSAGEYCLFTLGMTEIELGQFDDARMHFRQSLEIDRAAGGGLVAWGVHLGLARADMRTGKASTAATSLGEGVRRARALKSVQAQLYALGIVAEWLDARLERDRAAALRSFIAAHPRAEAADRDEAGSALGAMHLTPDQKKRATAAARALELDTLIDALTLELAG